MRKLRARLRWQGLLAAAALAGSITMAGATTAQAVDESPCRRPQVARASHWVQYCPLWRGNVPVYNSPDRGNNATVVGYLVQGGSVNWFVGDRYRSRYTFRTSSGRVLYNGWWAYTLADNGRWGWVPEVFFSGGENDETDGGLYLCDYGPRFNDCP
jgi:hypothetical protein